MNEPQVSPPARAFIREKGWWRKIWVSFSSMFRGRPQGGVQPKDTISKEFSTEVTKASNLLDFLMSEGHPYHIPDQIIDAIEAARDYLDDPDAPSKEGRAKRRADFKKAYRNLITISQTSVTFDRIPPTHFWSWHSWWLGSFLLITVMPFIILGAVYIIFYYGFPEIFNVYPDLIKTYWYLAIINVPISIFIFWYLYVFTGVVTNNKLNQIIKFCYIFTFVIVVASILPFTVTIPFSKLAEKSQIGILQACALGGDTGIPKEVLCTEKNDHYQWVVNIGGVAELWPAAEAAEPPPAPVEKKSAQLHAAVKGPPAPQPGPAEEPATEPKYRIRGGLVVPLYVIILALIGSAVSMTRRVPEYQGHSMDAQDSLTNVKARENLVFEIMQVISAPLIAITVYYIIDPTTAMWSVVLGFGSGFASAPILLMIRSLVDKLSPGATAKPSLISVRVDPPSVTLEPVKPQQFSAKVLGTPNSEVTWLIDPSDGSGGTITQGGYYVAPKSITNTNKTATITACSAADRTKSGNASVILEAGPSPA